MRIFLSYPSDQRRVADQINLGLLDAGHEVFFDRDDLQPGEAFDARIREEIERADLLIFLITPRSVAPGAYTLTELGLARKRWKTPTGRVLPVRLAGTPVEDVPAYLRAVTLLEPAGEPVAEVLGAVAELVARRGFRWKPLVAACGAAALVGLGGWEVWQTTRAPDVPMRAVTFRTPHEELARKGEVYVFRGQDAVAQLRFDESSPALAVGSYNARVLVQSLPVVDRPLPLSDGDGPLVTEIADPVTLTGTVLRGSERNVPVVGAVVKVGGATTRSDDDGVYVLADLPLQSGYEVQAYSVDSAAAFTEPRPWIGHAPNSQWKRDVLKNVWLGAQP